MQAGQHPQTRAGSSLAPSLPPSLPPSLTHLRLLHAHSSAEIWRRLAGCVALCRRKRAIRDCSSSSSSSAAVGRSQTAGLGSCRCLCQGSISCSVPHPLRCPPSHTLPTSTPPRPYLYKRHVQQAPRPSPRRRVQLDPQLAQRPQDDLRVAAAAAGRNQQQAARCGRNRAGSARQGGCREGGRAGRGEGWRVSGGSAVVGGGGPYRDVPGAQRCRELAALGQHQRQDVGCGGRKRRQAGG